jgi:FAD/FMN-containing dehydrogenase
MSIDDDSITQLGESFAGILYRPGDEGYDETRRVHNGMIDKRPAVIARCQGVADVVASVNFAREHGLEISIRGGGHNVAGRAVCEGGLMIDLASLKGIHVDPRSRTARAQAGLNWSEFNRETLVHGLATTGGVIGTTGIAGLTLGGGIGFLMGKYGLTIDNLLSAEVVTANGQVIRAAEDENQDLFWALRGGGGNFGVVTSFEYQLHPVGPDITGGLVAYPIEDAGKVLRFFREFAASIPDELTLFCALVHAPDGSGVPLAAIVPCHCGPLDEGHTAVQPLKEVSSPVMDMVGTMPYESINGMLDAGFPKGALNYWKSGILKGLTDEAIDKLVEQFSSCPSPMSSLFLEFLHGAVTRVGPTDTAFAHRDSGYNFAVISQWTNPEESDANITWAQETFKRMEPHMTTGAYVNYLDDDDPQVRVQGAYGPNFERLQAVKDGYDPENLFHLNQNIPPSS